MSQPDFNDILEDEARSLALDLNLPLIAVPKMFQALSTAYFLGYKDGAETILKSYDKHFRIHPDD